MPKKSYDEAGCWEVVNRVRGRPLAKYDFLSLKIFSFGLRHSPVFLSAVRLTLVGGPVSPPDCCSSRKRKIQSHNIKWMSNGITDPLQNRNISAERQATLPRKAQEGLARFIILDNLNGLKHAMGIPWAWCQRSFPTLPTFDLHDPISQYAERYGYCRTVNKCQWKERAFDLWCRLDRIMIKSWDGSGTCLTGSIIHAYPNLPELSWLLHTRTATKGKACGHEDLALWNRRAGLIKILCYMKAVL